VATPRGLHPAPGVPGGPGRLQGPPEAAGSPPGAPGGGGAGP